MHHFCSFSTKIYLHNGIIGGIIFPFCESCTAFCSTITLLLVLAEYMIGLTNQIKEEQQSTWNLKNIIITLHFPCFALFVGQFEVNVCIQWTSCGSGGREANNRTIIGSLTPVSMSKRAIDKDDWNKALCENGFKKSSIWIVHLSQFLINYLEYKSASFGAVVASWAVLHRCVDAVHIKDIAEPKDFPENRDRIPHFCRRRAFREPEHILTGLSCCVVFLSDAVSLRR